MPRPKSEEKRNAILAAAMHVFAERGLDDAPTSEISRRAGVAEGTLFTYFKTKDELINSLYQELKREVASAIMSDFQRQSNIEDDLRRIWNEYINWGVLHPRQRKALAQLQISDTITLEVRMAAAAPFTAIEAIVHDAFETCILRNDFSLDFIAKMMSALAEATMEMMMETPALADNYRTHGFELFWKGVTE